MVSHSPLQSLAVETAIQNNQPRFNYPLIFIQIFLVVVFEETQLRKTVYVFLVSPFVLHIQPIVNCFNYPKNPSTRDVFCYMILSTVYCAPPV